MDWDDVRVFLAIAKTGSVQGASRQLGVNPSTVTRRLAAFEERLRVRLFDRHPTGYTATSAGQALLETASQVHETLAEVEHRIVGRDDVAEGRVRLTLPPGTIQLIAPELAALLAENKGLELDVHEDLRVAELSRFEADVAVRLTGEPPPGLHGRKIADVAATLYASEPYLQTVRGRRMMSFIGPSVYAQGPARHRDGYGPAEVVARADSALTRRDLAEAGIGVTWLPCCIGDMSADLVRVPGLDRLDMLPMWALTHPELRRTKRVVLVMKLLCQVAERRADLLAGRKPRLRPSPAPARASTLRSDPTESPS